MAFVLRSRSSLQGAVGRLSLHQSLKLAHEWTAVLQESLHWQRVDPLSLPTIQVSFLFLKINSVSRD